ncbi:MAG: hypothetical protein HUK22_01800, partial [Thermoguttaceae bacterium]|nr:hypothetical protein [Thermoguttaceae bacterium]
AAPLAVEPGILPDLRAFLDFEAKFAGGRGVDYCLAVGPYPREFVNDGVIAGGETIVAFVDLRDPAAPVLRRETFQFGGHPAVIDPMFCNRAFDMLRKYQ